MLKRRRLIEFLLIYSMGCSGPQYAEKAEDVAPTPEAWEKPSQGALEEQVTFCSGISSELDQTLSTTLTQNLELKAAWERLQQAEAIATQNGATLYPTVSLQASAQRSKTAAPFGPAGSIEANQFQVSMPVAYELDLFGKLAAQREASEKDVEAARADTEALALSLAAQATEAWLDVVFHRERTRLLDEQISVAENYLELTLLRLSQGLASALDVNQQETDIRGLKARKEQALLAEELSLWRLGVLLGNAEKARVASDALPELGPGMSAGTPASVLEQRPDVRSAYLRLEAADARTAHAVRDRLPTIRLSANLFLQAAELGELFDDLFWSLGAQATQPIFEGGKRQARVDQFAAAARERLWVWAQAVNRAVQEVESAMAQEQAQVRVLDELQTQEELAKTSLDLARERYRSGALDYLRVLTALRSLQAVEQTLLDAQRQQLSFRVQTCRALGGAWTQSLEMPESKE